jgi:hypothetical protein
LLAAGQPGNGFKCLLQASACAGLRGLGFLNAEQFIGGNPEDGGMAESF